MNLKPLHDRVLVEPLEAVAGTKLDIDRLREVVGLSKQCTELWKQVLEAAASVPSPITFFDGTIQMGPAVVLRGDGTVEFLRPIRIEHLGRRGRVVLPALEDAFVSHRYPSTEPM